MITLGPRSALIVAAGVVVGLGGTACGEESSVAELSGTYRYHGANNGVVTWTVTPCGPGCANVASAAEGGYAAYHGQAKLSGNQWSMTAQRSDAGDCNARPGVY